MMTLLVPLLVPGECFQPGGPGVAAAPLVPAAQQRCRGQRREDCPSPGVLDWPALCWSAVRATFVPKFAFTWANLPEAGDLQAARGEDGSGRPAGSQEEQVRIGLGAGGGLVPVQRLRSPAWRTRGEPGSEQTHSRLAVVTLGCVSGLVPPRSAESHLTVSSVKEFGTEALRPGLPERPPPAPPGELP